MNETATQQAPVFESILVNMVIEGEVRDKLIEEIKMLINKLTQPIPSPKDCKDDCPITVPSPSIVQRLDAELNRMRNDNVRLSSEIKRLHELVGA